MNEHPHDFYLRLELTLHAFRGMAEHCPHRAADDPDCHHPDIDFDFLQPPARFRDQGGFTASIVVV